MVAEVVINSQAREVGRVFDYKIPDEMIGTVTLGQMVTVPFGMGNRIDTAFIVGLKETSDFKKLKYIDSVVGEEQLLRPNDIELAKWISEKYFCNLGAAMSLFFTDKVKARQGKVLNYNPTDDFVPNEEQKNAIVAITKSCDGGDFNEFLLHGVTGSGKTEVYIQAIKHAVSMGKGAIVLVPEISLTPQTVKRFVERLGDKVAVFHSRLNKGQKYEQWLKVKKGEASVVVGARSALFTPVQNLGIVIIDEEHDSSYKSGQTPFYHAREVAEELCKINKSTLVLGSATPDISTFYRAQTGKINLLTLSRRTNNKGLPNVKIVDMRNELVAGNKTIFSRDLYSEIKANLERKEQTILFLNRRGYATFVSCRKCGFVAKCNKCNIALTYHAESNKLVCHYCGAKFTNPTICPVCHDKYIKYFGIGTQKIENAVKKIFPEASIIRMDLDTTTKKDSHEEILKKFKDEKIDILIGTQMVAKGHDFPNVTLVGVVAADTSLNSNDFRAGERTFDLLTQVSGRAGRGEKEGRVIVQTYDSENYSILAAKEQNYEKFYEQEIIMREQLRYPPFCDIIVINFSGENENSVIENCRNIRIFLQENLRENNDVIVLKEVAAPISKINNKHRWRIVIKSNPEKNINNIINHLLIDKKFVTIDEVDCTIDFNPITFN